MWVGYNWSIQWFTFYPYPSPSVTNLIKEKKSRKNIALRLVEDDWISRSVSRTPSTWGSRGRASRPRTAHGTSKNRKGPSLRNQRTNIDKTQTQGDAKKKAHAAEQ